MYVLQSMCCVCLKTIDKYDIVDLHNVAIKGANAKDLLLGIFPEVVNVSTPVSNYMCSRCYKNFICIVKYKSSCIRSHIAIKDYVEALSYNTDTHNRGETPSPELQTALILSKVRHLIRSQKTQGYNDNSPQPGTSKEGQSVGSPEPGTSQQNQSVGSPQPGTSKQYSSVESPQPGTSKDYQSLDYQQPGTSNENRSISPQPGTSAENQFKLEYNNNDQPTLATQYQSRFEYNIFSPYDDELESIDNLSDDDYNVTQNLLKLISIKDDEKEKGYNQFKNTEKDELFSTTYDEYDDSGKTKKSNGSKKQHKSKSNKKRNKNNKTKKSSNKEQLSNTDEENKSTDNSSDEKNRRRTTNDTDRENSSDTSDKESIQCRTAKKSKDTDERNQRRSIKKSDEKYSSNSSDDDNQKKSDVVDDKTDSTDETDVDMPPSRIQKCKDISRKEEEIKKRVQNRYKNKSRATDDDDESTDSKRYKTESTQCDTDDDYMDEEYHKNEQSKIKNSHDDEHKPCSSQTVAANRKQLLRNQSQNQSNRQHDNQSIVSSSSSSNKNKKRKRKSKIRYVVVEETSDSSGNDNSRRRRRRANVDGEEHINESDDGLKSVIITQEEAVQEAIIDSLQDMRRQCKNVRKESERSENESEKSENESERSENESKRSGNESEKVDDESNSDRSSTSKEKNGSSHDNSEDSSSREKYSTKNKSCNGKKRQGFSRDESQKKDSDGSSGDDRKCEQKSKGSNDEKNQVKNDSKHSDKEEGQQDSGKVSRKRKRSSRANQNKESAGSSDDECGKPRKRRKLRDVDEELKKSSSSKDSSKPINKRHGIYQVEEERSVESFLYSEITDETDETDSTEKKDDTNIETESLCHSTKDDEILEENQVENKFQETNEQPSGRENSVNNQPNESQNKFDQIETDNIVNEPNISTDKMGTINEQNTTDKMGTNNEQLIDILVNEHNYFCKTNKSDRSNDDFYQSDETSNFIGFDNQSGDYFRGFDTSNKTYSPCTWKYTDVNPNAFDVHGSNLQPKINGDRRNLLGFTVNKHRVMKMQSMRFTEPVQLINTHDTVMSRTIHTPARSHVFPTDDVDFETFDSNCDNVQLFIGRSSNIINDYDRVEKIQNKENIKINHQNITSNVQEALTKVQHNIRNQIESIIKKNFNRIVKGKTYIVNINKTPADNNKNNIEENNNNNNEDNVNNNIRDSINNNVYYSIMRDKKKQLKHYANNDLNININNSDGTKNSTENNSTFMDNINLNFKDNIDDEIMNNIDVNVNVKVIDDININIDRNINDKEIDEIIMKYVEKNVGDTVIDAINNVKCTNKFKTFDDNNMEYSDNAKDIDDISVNDVDNVKGIDDVHDRNSKVFHDVNIMGQNDNAKDIDDSNINNIKGNFNVKLSDNINLDSNINTKCINDSNVNYIGDISTKIIDNTGFNRREDNSSAKVADTIHIECNDNAKDIEYYNKAKHIKKPDKIQTVHDSFLNLNDNINAKITQHIHVNGSEHNNDAKINLNRINNNKNVTIKFTFETEENTENRAENIFKFLQNSYVKTNYNVDFNGFRIDEKCVAVYLVKCYAKFLKRHKKKIYNYCLLVLYVTRKDNYFFKCMICQTIYVMKKVTSKYLFVKKFYANVICRKCARILVRNILAGKY